eukprot:1835490-Heterocapsa_arctica.AAC.1
MNKQSEQNKQPTQPNGPEPMLQVMLMRALHVDRAARYAASSRGPLGRRAAAQPGRRLRARAYAAATHRPGAAGRRS